MSFPPAFREAAYAVMLSAHRLLIPKDVCNKIVKFMSNRDWWTDERRLCFNQLCPKTFSPENKSQTKEGRQQLTTDFVRCRTCSIAVYCSDECRKADRKERHKPYCNVPPFRVPTYEEEMLIEKVMGNSSPLQSGTPAADNVKGIVVGEVAGNFGNDDDDWEDVDSDDENDDGEVPSKTRTIYKFFRDKAYKPRGIGDL